MIYLESAPSPVLRPWVRALWYCHLPGAARGRERVLPDGCMQIIFNLSRHYLPDCGESGTGNGRIARAIVVGLRARYDVIETSDMEELAGIVIEPGGFGGLFGERADLCFGKSLALCDLQSDSRLIDSMLEASMPADKIRCLDRSLVELLRGDSRRNVTVDHALHLFNNKGAGVIECAKSIGVSERHLSRIFREEVGMSPKLWCRIRRFQAIARNLHARVDTPWAELALECGYFDQSHFSNDFKAFSGLNPTTYSTHTGRWHNHVSID
jgi:AraC-like DNA-binding protein